MSEVLDNNPSENIEKKSIEENKEEEKENKKEEKKDKSQTLYWKEECMKSNLMPGIIMLEQKKINVDEEVNSTNGNTLLHYAASYGFYNAIRALIEIYNADINKQNKIGYSPLFYIVNNLDTNIFNFQYFVKLKKINFELTDINNLNILVHSIITHFHYAFLYFSYHGLIEKYHGDIYENPLIYFSIIYNNKFTLSYLLLKKTCDINANYFKKSAILSDILITNKYNSITKFLLKYFNEEINLQSINTCKKGLLNFPYYNIFNYELLNTLYFFKTNNYFKFILALIKNHKPKFNNDSSKALLDDKLVNNDIGYKYKMVNLKYMIYDLILPKIPKTVKIITFFIYLCLLYFGTKEKIYFYFLYRNEMYIVFYKMITSFSLLILFIYMFFSSDKTLSNDKEIESDIVNIINNGNVIDLPNIDEICPACSTRKNLNDSHCYRCKGCYSNRFFHSNLFEICITKHCIKRYLFYVFLKINFYLICFFNCYEKNKNKLFEYQSGFINLFFEIFILFMIFKDTGHLIWMILSLMLQTPYQFIYKYHKKVYPGALKENIKNKMVIQYPEIEEKIGLKNYVDNCFNNIC
jgi:ankyrin repeat protein